VRQAPPICCEERRGFVVADKANHFRLAYKASKVGLSVGAGRSGRQDSAPQSAKGLIVAVSDENFGRRLCQAFPPKH